MTATLSFTPIRDGYTAIPTYPIIEIMYDGGTVEKRLDTLFATHEVNVNWKLVNPTQYTNFMGFFRTTLLEATEFFLMDLVTDIGALIPHRCRTKGGMPKLTQVNGSCFYVSAVLEVEVNPTYTDLISYQGPDLVVLSSLNPRFVGPLQPGDTIMIFNSEGSHPEGHTQWVFDGVDDRISTADIHDFERTSPFSVSGWFSSDSLTEPNGGRMVSKADTTANQRGWFVGGAGVLGGNHVQFGLINTVVTNNIRVETTATYSNDTLYHFVATYDGSSTGAGVTIYIDGVSEPVTIVNNNLSATTLSSAVLTLGNREDGARAFNGLLSHLAVWDVELSAGDVTEIYNNGTPPDLLSVSAAANLVAWWKLDALDTTGAGNIQEYVNNDDGTAQGSLAPIGLVGPTDLNLDGTYVIASVDPNNEIQLVSPAAVNSDWLVLSDLGSYGTESLGNVISTITRLPRTT